MRNAIIKPLQKNLIVNSHGKKTNRLVSKILNTSTKLSSVSASILLKSNSVKVCKSSICDLLKKNAIHCG